MLVYSREQLPTKRRLDTIRREAVDLSNANGRKMEELQRQVNESLLILQSLDRRTSAPDSASIGGSTVAEDLDETARNSLLSLQRLGVSDTASGSAAIDTIPLLAQQLANLRSLAESTQTANQTLRLLHFPGILRRENDISAAKGETFSWIIADPEAPDLDPPRRDASRALKSFLRFEGRTFFFCGKAGAGKSTMMKFLGENPAVSELLTAWAGPRQLVVVRMFFWSSGAELQRTLEGFYRTILFHTLNQCPDLVARVFPQHRRDGDFYEEQRRLSLLELEQAFDRLVRVGDCQYRFCYFIDGLDEYEGDNLQYLSLSKKIAFWAKSEGVKIVCSARPYTVFRDAFKDAGVTIEFHQLTRSDLANFATCQFNEHLCSLPVALQDCLNLVDEIVTRADGIFLWASLVVRSLINDAIDGEDETTMQERLQECPDGLNDMFRKMLAKVEPSPSVRRRSNLVMYLAVHYPLTSLPAPNALLFSWLTDASWFQDPRKDFPRGLNPRPYTPTEVEKRVDRVRKMLSSLTQGLLEVSADAKLLDMPYFQHRVVFIHRSVRDFLTNECTRPFHTDRELAEAYARLLAAEVRFVPNIPELRETVATNAKLKARHSSFPWAPGSHSDLCHALFTYVFRWLRELAVSGAPGPSAHHVQDFWDATGLPGESSTKLPNPWAEVFDRSGIMQMGIDGNLRQRKKSPSPFSFIHYAANHCQLTYIRHVAEMRGALADYDTHGLNFLLASSLAGDIHGVRYFLNNGWHPHDLVDIWDCGPEGKGSTASVWHVFLRRFAYNAGRYHSLKGSQRWKKHNTAQAAIIEQYLRAGAALPVYFIVRVCEVEDEDGDGDVREQAYKEFHLDLDQLLQFSKSPSAGPVTEMVKSTMAAAQNASTWSRYEDGRRARPALSLADFNSNRAYIDGVVSHSAGELIGDFGARMW